MADRAARDDFGAERAVGEEPEYFLLATPVIARSEATRQSPWDGDCFVAALLAMTVDEGRAYMIELSGVAPGNKLRLVGGITAEVLEIVNDEWAKVRLIEVPTGEIGTEE